MASNDEIANIVVVFSALTHEAYINNYGITRISGNYFSKYLYKADLVAKLLFIPNVVTGYQLNPGSTTIRELDWLVALRIKLIHYTSKKIAIDKSHLTDILWYEDAARAVRAVNLVIGA